ncbi:P-loop containing nucleoside triphosphate hydrolase protein [Penicillium canariense]|uniref:P-loop containing nucleoside triphosphate hydrolase protein n=1 Tax=Penicillium canariense TaxID=189055 RepID=A0A9W9IFB5_9EURO|nr:P-loop containing nucleoside triphosphate hydrolase protein [Penicillium canariense]KAJ5175317.1 P-loop containing nucleoside triphosphate hydrolase protein [Penicillium canariense]
MEVDTATEMANAVIAPPPFEKRLGYDCPRELWTTAIMWRPCQLTVGNKLFSGKYHVVLESQQPRVAFGLHNSARGQVIFTDKNCAIETGFEQDEPNFVDQHRGQFDLKGGPLSFIKIRPSAQPAILSKVMDEASEQAERDNCQALNSVCWQVSETIIWIPYEAEDCSKLPKRL